jgi:putative transcriptional regulator
MSRQKQLRFAMGWVAVALMATAAACIHRAESAVPKSNLESWGSWAAAFAGRSPDRQAPGSAKSELPPAFLVPAQSTSPDSLAAGKLLVASRSMGDPGFAKTVILLVRYDATGGVLGLVLNRRTDVPISRVLDLKSAKDRADPVYAGGPVESRAVFALFKSPARLDKAENIFGRVYFITDKDVFDHTLSAHPDPAALRVYLGYTGWTQAQLRHEVQVGAWFVLPADDAAVFTSDPDSLWLQMIQRTKSQLAKMGD